MAFAALVRCAGANTLNAGDAPEEPPSLAWYCIELLLDAISPDEQVGNVGKEKGIDTSIRSDMGEARLHRLRLTLISAVPSLPLSLVLRALEKIKTMITSIPMSSPKLISSEPSESILSNGGEKEKDGTRDELVEALFQEIMGQVGYREKGVVMQWWYENRMDLQATQMASVGEDRTAPITYQVDGCPRVKRRTA